MLGAGFYPSRGFPRPSSLGRQARKLIGRSRRLIRDPGVLQPWEIPFFHITRHPWAPPDRSPPSNPSRRIPIRGKFYHAAPWLPPRPREDAQPWETPSPGILPSG
jgi:hypothetical protein